MKKRRIPIIAVTSHAPQNAMPLLEGVAAYAEQNGPWRFSSMVATNAGFLNALSRDTADGIISHMPPNNPPQFADVVRRLHRRGKPIVLLTTRPVCSDVPVVGPDDPAIGRMAAQHLLERSLPRYTFLGVDDSWSTDREEGFAQTIRRAGLPVTVSRLTWMEIHDSGRMRSWIADLTPPAGIMGASDTIATAVIEACESAGFAVPEKFAVIGTDNNPILCRFTPTTITSVEHDHFQTGFRAAQILHDMMRGRPIPNQPVLIEPKGIVTRRSTQMPLFADPDIHNAVQFIRDFAHEDIDVGDVVEEVELSRRSVERKFRKVVGRTVDQEIRRVRLDEARRLLLSTDMPLIDIAIRCGFTSLSYLSQAFKKEFQSSPRRYRLDHRHGSRP